MRRWMAGLAVVMLTVMGGGITASGATASDLAPRASVAKAPARGAWAGTSTDMSRTFSYGAVSFTVGKGVITDFVIEGVTASGCGGFTTIAVPRLTIQGNRITGSYQPSPGIDDVIIVRASFAGGVIRGAFTEGPLCRASGRFTARPR